MSIKSFDYFGILSQGIERLNDRLPSDAFTRSGSKLLNMYLEASGERTLGVALPRAKVEPICQLEIFGARGPPIPAFVHRTLLHVIPQKFPSGIFLLHKFSLDFCEWHSHEPYSTCHSLPK